MSNPSSSLKKGKRTPLPGVGKRPVPFRNSSSQSVTDKILDDALRSPSQQSSRSDYSVNRGRPSHLPKLDRHQQENTSAPSDFDLMNGMMNKIAQLELQVKYYAREVMQKDKKIRILVEKAKLKERSSSMGNHDSSDHKLREMEKKCEGLQNHINEMEDFLADYGMVFVGGSSSTDEVDGMYEDLSVGKQGIWRPERGGFHVDYDKIAKNVRELNIIGGEGEKLVQHTVKGAKLQTREAIPLTLYTNGIFMFNGPFRLFSDRETQRCVQDLMDGFFPGELQERYPDGVPIKLNDQRDTAFRDPWGGEQFPGVGQLVGGESAPSRLVPTNLDKTTNTDLGNEDRLDDSNNSTGLHYTSKPPGIQMSADQFLDKLPSSVMRDGKVIEIRSSVADSLKDKEAPPTVTVIETSVIKETKNRDRPGHQKDTTTQSPSPSGSSPGVTTLRVKSASGDRTFIVKMRYEDTIRDLRAHLDKYRPFPAAHYELMTTFPNKTYSDLDMTLEECGLIPNATMYMKKN